jgi:hypothetical protein
MDPRTEVKQAGPELQPDRRRKNSSYLKLDLTLQFVPAEDAVGGRRLSASVDDPSDGAVIALVDLVEVDDLRATERLRLDRSSFKAARR